ncbi:hypothetical protein RFI_09378 [Reticulomyxa filosa]|uniref:Uncharacterized protein n=1 Tax=Reticulomyxa filosa TaxID=46433 RepID=X6NQW7_RETFI|nr:hypothetical protein RFI_09378 [Reticulomyxa filosa]|eukprot:ETO27752.1 hypothetical protein RFI_09378 [Reticulomyxa filosa]
MCEQTYFPSLVLSLEQRFFVFFLMILKQQQQKYLKKSQTPVLTAKWFEDMCLYAVDNLTKKKSEFESRRSLGLECMKCLLVWVRSDPEILTQVDASMQLQALVRKSLTVGIDQANAPNTPWQTAMTSKSSQDTIQSRNNIRDIRVTALALARELTNDLGSYTGTTTQPLQKFAETALEESQIEEHIERIKQKLTPSEASKWKWTSTDRIRFFSYRRERMITIVEMPRVDDSSFLADTADVTSLDLNDSSGGAGAEEVTPKKPGKQTEDLDRDTVVSPNAKSPSRTLSPSSEKSKESQSGSVKSSLWGSCIDATMKQNLERYPWRKPPLSQANFADEKDLENYCNLYKNKQETKSRLCNLIILVRDAFGKYAWETTCHYDDLHELAPPIQESKTKSIHSSPETPSTQDVFSEIFANSQRFAKDKKFLEKSSEIMVNIDTDVDDGETKPSDEKQAKKRQVKSVKMSPDILEKQIENKVKSNHAAWSSCFVSDNWMLDLKQDSSVKQLADAIQMQQVNEASIIEFHKKFQEKSGYSTKTITTPISPSSSSSFPSFMDSVDIYSATKPPSPPPIDEAATFCMAASC